MVLVRGGPSTDADGPKADPTATARVRIRRRGRRRRGRRRGRMFRRAKRLRQPLRPTARRRRRRGVAPRSLGLGLSRADRSGGDRSGGDRVRVSPRDEAQSLRETQRPAECLAPSRPERDAAKRLVGSRRDVEPRGGHARQSTVRHERVEQEETGARSGSEFPRPNGGDEGARAGFFRDVALGIVSQPSHQAVEQIIRRRGKRASEESPEHGTPDGTPDGTPIIPRGRGHERADGDEEHGDLHAVRGFESTRVRVGRFSPTQQKREEMRRLLAKSFALCRRPERRARAPRTRQSVPRRRDRRGGGGGGGGGPGGGRPVRVGGRPVRVGGRPVRVVLLRRGFSEREERV